MSPGAAAKRFRRMATALPQAVEQANMQSAIVGLNAAIRFSSGTLTYVQLQKMGHPYSRSGSSIDPSIINAHRGDFRAHWHISVKPDGTVSLINDSKVAGFMKHGTLSMVMRPIQQRVEAVIERDREKRIYAAIRRSLS